MHWWLSYQQQEQQQRYTQQYTRMLASSSASHLGSFINSQDQEALESIANNLFNNDSIFAVAIYQRDGALLAQYQDEQLPTDAKPMVADILFRDEKIGYLTLYYSPLQQSSLLFQLKSSPLMVWIVSGFSWLLIALLISFRQLRRWRKHRRQQQPTASLPEEPTTHQILRQLLKHNNGKRKEDIQGIRCVISADWSRLDEQSSHQLLKVFNRWLPQNAFYLSSFKHSLLTLVQNSDSATNNLIPQLQVLQKAMQQLKLEPVILLHSMDFEREIYQTFFEVLEPGIWLESEVSDNHQLCGEKHIELDIETVGSINLTLAPAISSQQRSGLERQVRYLLNT